jgi:CBS-domain-containing membrane protein
MDMARLRFPVNRPTQISKTLHPPGGATALIAVIGLRTLKPWLPVCPVTCATGSLILLAVALVFNNITEFRKHPTDRNSRSLYEKVQSRKK